MTVEQPASEKGPPLDGPKPKTADRRIFGLFVRHWGWILVVGSLLYLHLPALVGHWKNSLDPLRFHDDVRIHIWPYFHYSNPLAFRADYLGDYALDAFMPLGFRVLYTVGAYVWDPEPLSKLLPYVTLLMTVVAVGFAAHRFGKKLGVWVAVAVVLGSEIYLDRMGGGLSRAFAYPVIAGGLAVLVYGRVRWAAAVVFVGAAFYPMVGVALGVALVTYLFVLPKADRGEAQHWNTVERLKFIGAVGGISIVLLLPLAITQARHGPLVTHEDIATFPEAGPLGTVSRGDIPPYPPFFQYANKTVKRSLLSDGDPFVRSLRAKVQRAEKSTLEILLILFVLGWYRLARDDKHARRLIVYLLGMVVAHFFSRVASPYAYTPSRYVHYGLPPVIAIIAAGTFVGILSYWRVIREKEGLRNLLAVLPSVVMMGFIGGAGSQVSGLTVRVSGPLAQIYDAVKTLPEDALIAGWPDDPMSNLPYVARRTAYWTGEMHMPHHQKHLEEGRRRLRPFFEAYFARDLAPIQKLREEMGVTHLFVDTHHLRGRPPGYMPPMGAWVKEINARGRGKRYELLNHVGGPAVVKRAGRWVLLDLSKIGG